MENQEEIGTYPFVQIDSYFGEIELFEDEMRRKWGVTARTPLVLFAISKNNFFKICDKFDDFRRALHKKMVERHSYFDKCDRECGRAIRRVNRVDKKIKKMKESAMKNAVKTIQKSKQVGKNKWHETFLKLTNKVISSGAKQGREKRQEKALSKLEAFYKNNDDEVGKGNLRGKRRKAINVDIYRDTPNPLNQGSTEVSPDFARRVDAKRKSNADEWNLDNIVASSNKDTKKTKNKKKKKLKLWSGQKGDDERKRREERKEIDEQDKKSEYDDDEFDFDD